MTDQPATLHATAIAVDGAGAALIIGPPGSGKSDLALRAIHQPIEIAGCRRRVRLVADDRVHVAVTGSRLIARAPPTIAGLIELRGLGIVKLDHLPEAPIVLAAMLVEGHAIERLPDHDREWTHEGFTVPLLHLAPFEASAPIKLVLATCRAADAVTARASGGNRG